ncbi:Coproporphyrinogen III oxidase [Globomyces pollinis-pini]|nr:Coproporphyrinogen III oxidase [Globomyces pollinis-pini]
MVKFVESIQKELTEGIEELEGPEGNKFFLDRWERKEGGYGVSAVLQDGKVFEKAGVNYSVIKSKAPKPMLQQMRSKKDLDIDVNNTYDMFVAGVSMVMHPHNPNAPTFHANYRYFELRKEGSDPDSEPVAWWFGGGCDLTPCYFFLEDAVHFHKTIKDVCDKHNPTYYPDFKKWCDNYFMNTHRNESRGIGGIFFDDLNNDKPQTLFNFVNDCGHVLKHQYIPIVKKRMDLPFTSEMKEWQQLRRGRYVEFNLIHDRGTKFGLATPGVRIESVLMSLPLTARWQYCHEPAPGSREEEMLNILKSKREWL